MNSSMKLGLVVLAGIAILMGVGFVMMNRSSKTVSMKVDSQAAPTVMPVVTPVVTPQVLGEVSLPLTITSPVDKSEVKSISVTVKGKTKAGVDVFVNELESKADGSGNFAVNLNLEDGENYIEVTVIDDQGNAGEKEIMVTYNSGV